MLRVLISLALLFVCTSAFSSPIDSNPSESLTALYNKLTTGKTKIRFGSYYEPNGLNGSLTEAYKITGYIPSFFEYRANGTTIYGGTVGQPWASPDTNLAKNYYDAGAVISVMWPTPNFSSTCIGNCGPGVADSSQNLTGSPCAAILSGSSDTTARANYLSALDALATWATDPSKMNGRAFIFRPFHEADGNWTWWSSNTSNSCTDSEYKQLWQEMVVYLRDTKGVHNILYAYSPEVIRTYTTYDGSRYPGDNYVDIFGIDLYSNSDDLTATGCQYYDCDVLTRYREAASKAKSHGKIFGITEGMRTISTHAKYDYWSWWINQLVEDVSIKSVAYINTWSSPDWGLLSTRTDAVDFRNFFYKGNICLLDQHGECAKFNYITNASLNNVSLK